MKTQSTYTSWNFTTTWAICEGTNYPRLLWSIPASDFACPDGIAFEDFAFLSQYWLETTNEADLTGDSVVNMDDVIRFGETWLE